MSLKLRMFQSGKIGKLTIKNRFVRSATYEGLAKEPNGEVTDKLLKLYQKLAEGEIGLITTGFSFVQENGKAFYNQIGIHKDELLPGLRKLVKIVKDRSDSRIFIQIAHAGRQVFPDFAKSRDIIAPSSLTDKLTNITPREMTREDITACIRNFIAAGRRAYEAEFDGVQLHLAHGYLLSEFISPHYNQRTDEYGGSIENRFRIIQEIIRGIYDETDKQFPVTVKLNAADFVKDEPQLTITDSKIIARMLIKEGIAAIEVSGGTYESTLLGNYTPSRTKIKSKENEAYFLPEAKIIKREVKDLPIILVGGIRSKAVAEEVLEFVDFVALSRPFIQEPDLVKKWQQSISTRAECISCNRCLFEQGGKGLRCIYMEKIQKRKKRKQQINAK